MSRPTDLPGRDRRAVRHPAPVGAPALVEARSVVVVGGGIAGLAAAAVLAEHGARVTLLEASTHLGGRVAAWPVDAERTMSRGFHAFFRQYYNLRALLRRADPDLTALVPVEDYPLQRPDGLRDSFARIPRTPPWSFIGFVLQSPSFTLRSLAGVNVPAAMELLQVRFPETYAHYDGESAKAFLDRMRFPAEARDLALEVFARSFFADPDDFAAGELVAMFHTYFMGSAEGLLFDVPADDYDTSLWRPLARYLEGVGVDIRTGTPVESIHPSAADSAGRAGVRVRLAASGQLDADAVVVATDPRTARTLVAGIDPDRADSDRERVVEWQQRVAATHNAPPFVVVRLWLQDPVAPERPAFLGTSGYGPLDNISVLERFEDGAARWREEHGGSVVELHAYSADPSVVSDREAADAVVHELERQLYRAYPETLNIPVRHREVLVRDDCTLIGPDHWSQRPGVETPLDQLVLAGDWVACDYPVALMERATTTGALAANRLLASWGVAGQDVWTVPMRGLLAR